MTGWTEEELAEALRLNPALKVLLPGALQAPGTTTRTAREIIAAPCANLQGNKYKNRRTEYNGHTYASKKEVDFAKELDLRVQAGEILSWIPQVRFPLPGGSSHVVDFMAIVGNPIVGDPESGHVVTFWEVKGRDLPMGRLKRKQVEEIYHIKINLV